MAERLFNVGVGLADDRISYLSGTGIPGADASYQDAAEVGSKYADIATGEQYRKITAGSGTGNWDRIPTLADLTGQTNEDPWRNPAVVYTEATEAAVLTDIDTDDIIDGVTVVSGDRILINEATNPNVFIVGGSTGAWTLTEDANAETAGDTVKIIGGSKDGNEYTYNGTLWIWTGSSTEGEDGFQNTFMGKTVVGVEAPAYSTNNVVANGDSLTTAIGKLDTQVGTNTSDISTNVASISTNSSNIATNTGNITTNSTNIATNVTNIATNTGNITTNSTNIATNVTNIATNTGNITANTTAITNLQSATGLAGTYVATPASNYLSTATSLDNADQLLDTQVKVNADAIATNATLAGSAQAELDLTQIALGGSIDGAGGYVAHSGTNFLDGNTNLTEDITDLDAAIVANSGNVTSLSNEVAAIEASSGGLFTIGTGVWSAATLSGTNYLSAATSVSDGFVKLDTQVKTNADGVATNVTNIATNVTNIATNTGNITTNTGNITTNATNIATNVSNITTNTNDIATNTTNIAGNTANITTNTTDITNLTALLNSTVVVTTATGAVTHTLDTILVDEKVAAKWIVTITDPANGNRQALEVYAMHDGYAANDATVVDWNRYSKLKVGSNIAGVDLNITLTGAGVTQAMNLVVSASANIDVNATRLSA